MHKILISCLLATFFVACSTPLPPEEDPITPEKVAFPQAEGAGCTTTGGRNGAIYYVTSLEDDVNLSGTFRYAVTRSVARIIIFKVAGVIDLKSPLRIKNGNLTILGQSAPGDGICIKGYPVIIEADNVIVRFIRFRMGDKNGVEGDALTCIGRNNVVIDHCSMSWSTDECASCYGNTNFTMQYCIVSESLRSSVHVKGTHGYGGIWGGSNVTFHHNLLAHHDSRNPRFDHDHVATKRGPLDFVNNVIYNWRGNSTYGGESTATNNTEYRTINMQNNYYKYGPATPSDRRNRILNPWISCDNCNHANPSAILPGHFFIEGNFVYGSEAVTANNWKGGVQGVADNILSKIKANSRFEVQPAISSFQTAEDAYETVLNCAGASLVRDIVDTRIVKEVREGIFTHTGSNGSRSGLIDSQEDVGGWPNYCYDAKDVPTDSDGDGIPDDWEIAHGLDPTNYADGKTNTIDKNYNNIEVYLNNIVEHLY